MGARGGDRRTDPTRAKRDFIIDTDRGSFPAKGRTVADAVKIVARKYPDARVWTIREPGEGE